MKIIAVQNLYKTARSSYTTYLIGKSHPVFACMSKIGPEASPYPSIILVVFKLLGLDILFSYMVEKYEKYTIEGHKESLSHNLGIPFDKSTVFKFY